MKQINRPFCCIIAVLNHRSGGIIKALDSVKHRGLLIKKFVLKGYWTGILLFYLILLNAVPSLSKYFYLQNDRLLK